MVDDNEDGSVLAHLGVASWSEKEGIAYEVAIDGINQVVGAYSALIAREERAGSSDTAAIEAWKREQGAWAARRRKLSPTNPVSVRQVTHECAGRLSELRGQR